MITYTLDELEALLQTYITSLPNLNLTKPQRLSSLSEIKHAVESKQPRQQNHQSIFLGEINSRFFGVVICYEYSNENETKKAYVFAFKENRDNLLDSLKNLFYEDNLVTCFFEPEDSVLLVESMQYTWCYGIQQFNNEVDANKPEKIPFFIEKQTSQITLSIKAKLDEIAINEKEKIIDLLTIMAKYHKLLISWRLQNQPSSSANNQLSLFKNLQKKIFQLDLSDVNSICANLAFEKLLYILDKLQKEQSALLLTELAKQKEIEQGRLERLQNRLINAANAANAAKIKLSLKEHFLVARFYFYNVTYFSLGSQLANILVQPAKRLTNFFKPSFLGLIISFVGGCFGIYYNYIGGLASIVSGGGAFYVAKILHEHSVAESQTADIANAQWILQKPVSFSSMLKTVLFLSTLTMSLFTGDTTAVLEMGFVLAGTVWKIEEILSFIYKEFQLMLSIKDQDAGAIEFIIIQYLLGCIRDIVCRYNERAAIIEKFSNPSTTQNISVEFTCLWWVLSKSLSPVDYLPFYRFFLNHANNTHLRKLICTVGEDVMHVNNATLDEAIRSLASCNLIKEIFFSPT